MGEGVAHADDGIECGMAGRGGKVPQVRKDGRDGRPGGGRHRLVEEGLAGIEGDHPSIADPAERRALIAGAASEIEGSVLRTLVETEFDQEGGLFVRLLREGQADHPLVMGGEEVVVMLLSLIHRPPSVPSRFSTEGTLLDATRR